MVIQVKFPAFFLRSLRSSSFLFKNPFQLEVSRSLSLALLLLGFGCVPLMGSTVPAVKSVTCTYAAYLGIGTDPCTVVLTTAAGSSGLTIALKSTTSEAAVPTSLNVVAGATSASFSTKIVTGLTNLAATLTASGGGSSASFSLTLVGDQYGLKVNTTSLPFGDSAMNLTPTQSIILKSTGKETVTVSSATISSASFLLKGVSLPLQLAPGASATWDIEFKPISVGTHSGHLTITSDSDLSPTNTVALTGTGIASAYEVNLSWSAPTRSSNVVGYHVYRATGGSSIYQLLDSSLVPTTSYLDGTVSSGTTYDYYVESVSSTGLSSAPSSVFAIAVP